MKLALECPTNLLGAVQPLADFDWILAHLVLQDEKYAEYYKRSGRFKVLDNSVNELLEPILMEDLVKATNIVLPNLVVAPDFLGDSGKTWEALHEATYMLGKARVLPVVQGSSLEEVLDLFGKLLVANFENIAVPYDILSSRKDSPATMASNRVKVVNSIINEAPIGFNIHLLGMTTIEELTQHNKGWVKSIDTGVPVLLGSKGYAIERANIDKSRPTMSQFGEVSVDTAHLGSIYYNIAYLRKILNSR